MEFKLNEKEIAAKERFYRACKKLLGDKDVRLVYKFIPTGIGYVVKVVSLTLDIESDITDYESW